MILVTGATGFIGSYVHRRLLLDGHEAVGVSRYAPRPETAFVLRPVNPIYESADIRDADSLRHVFARYKPEVVIHLDAYVNPVQLRSEPLLALEYNFMETVNVLEQARAVGVQRVVFASSIAALPSIRYEPIDANHPIVTAREGPGGGFYGAAKAASEIVGLQYSEAFGVDFRIVRPSAVYGFGMQWPIGVKPVIEGLVEGKHVTIDLTAPKRDLTPVHDVASIFASAAICPPEADRVFYAATGEPLTSGQDLHAIVRELFPGGVIDLSDTPQDGSDIESRYRGRIDMRPAREQLAFRPSFTSLRDGLDEYAETYREFISGL